MPGTVTVAPEMPIQDLRYLVRMCHRDLARARKDDEHRPYHPARAAKIQHLEELLTLLEAYL